MSSCRLCGDDDNKEKVVLVLFWASVPLSLFFVYIGSIKLGSFILLSAFRGVLFVNVGYL